MKYGSLVWPWYCSANFGWSVCWIQARNQPNCDEWPRYISPMQKHDISAIIVLSVLQPNQPPITLLIERSTIKLEVVGSIPGLVNLTVINCLSDETFNRGSVWRCYTPSTLKNQAELSVVSSCILSLSRVTTNRLLGASLRWATGSDHE